MSNTVVAANVNGARARVDDTTGMIRLAIFTAVTENATRYLVPTAGGYAITTKPALFSGYFQVDPDGAVTEVQQNGMGTVKGTYQVVRKTRTCTSGMVRVPTP